MATQIADAPFKYRSAPTATEAFEGWLKEYGQNLPVHTHPWDVSRSDIYVEDRWQPIFAEMRAKAPVNKVTGTPYGDYWNVTTVKTIQHVESLPELYSSSWLHGGITIGDPPADMTPEMLEERRLPMFIAMDRPEHTGQRRTVAPAFTPGEIDKMAAEVRMRTAATLDSLPWGEEFDWVDKVSIELTTGMLAILFGFPWEDRRLLTFWSDGARAGRYPARNPARNGALLPDAVDGAHGCGTEPRPDLDDDPFGRDEPHEPAGVHGQPRPADRRRQRYHPQHHVGHRPGAGPVPRPARDL